MKIIFLLLLFFPFTYTQTISNHRIDKIITLLITNSPDISNYINADELQIANRFGIEYEEIENKYLIFFRNSSDLLQIYIRNIF